MIPAVLALLIPFAALGLGGFKMFLRHQRELAEIQARGGGTAVAGGNVSGDVRAELQALRDEVARLRDTSTKFDLSFDAGLTRLEGRVERTERDAAGVSSSLSAVLLKLDAQSGASGRVPDAEPVAVQRVGGR